MGILSTYAAASSGYILYLCCSMSAVKFTTYMKYVKAGETMRFICVLLFAELLCFSFSGASLAKESDISLQSLLGSKQVLIIGESYGQPESEQFFSK